MVTKIRIINNFKNIIFVIEVVIIYRIIVDQGPSGGAISGPSSAAGMVVSTLSPLCNLFDVSLGLFLVVGVVLPLGVESLLIALIL